MNRFSHNDIKAFIDNLPAHAKVETGGKQADRPGFYFEPTVITLEAKPYSTSLAFSIASFSSVNF
jgi:acyl-CoA reductase-like NAD-dependent aldehyde dehydrogenase